MIWPPTLDRLWAWMLNWFAETVAPSVRRVVALDRLRVPPAASCPLSVALFAAWTVKLPLLAMEPSAFKPAAMLEPVDALTCAAAFSVVLPFAAITAVAPVLLMSPWLTSVLLPLAYTVPLFMMPAVALSCVLPMACMRPLLLSQPLFCRTTSPADAPIAPALRMPRPASVPTRKILPAYMPPSCATSSAYAGTAPIPATGIAELCAASTWLLPAVTLRSLAQMPALTCTALAMMLVKPVVEASSPAPLMLTTPRCTI